MPQGGSPASREGRTRRPPRHCSWRWRGTGPPAYTGETWGHPHTRRINTEEKAKVVASVWGGGENLLNSLPR